MYSARKIQLFAFVVALTLFLVASVFAERLPVKIYTSADGLGSGFVDYLTRDSRGFMWFCTRDGLSRFDGSQFVTYQIGEKGSPPGIEFFGETADGVYWISTTGGVFRFNPNANDRPFDNGLTINAEYVNGWRGVVFQDSKANIWLGSTGIFRRVQKDGKSDFERQEWNIPPRPNVTFNIFEIVETSDGSLWLMSSWGLLRRLPDERIIDYTYENLPNGGAGAISMTSDKAGRIWVSLNNVLYAIKPESIESLEESESVVLKSIRPTTIAEIRPESPYQLPKVGGEIVQFKNPDFIEKAPTMRLLQTSDGDMWVTAENYLLQFSGGVLHLHDQSEGLPNVMNKMAEDAAGNLWIGGFTGLARLDRNGFRTYGSAEGAFSSRFFAINEGPDGKLYFANSDAHISEFDGERFQIARPAVEPNPSYLWASRFTFIDSNGDWWILTNGKLYRFSATPKFADLNGIKPAATYTSRDGLKSDGMYQIFEDSGGDIWVSTRGPSGSANGIARLKKGETRFRTFTEEDGLPEGHASTCFAEDRNGNIWMGFYEGGFARFDGDRFDYFEGVETGPPTGIITDMLLDDRGRLWISATNNGIFRIDDTSAKVPVLFNWNSGSGLTSNNVRTIVEDKFGRIYAGTARGVDRLSPDSGHVRHYSVNDGLASDFVVDSLCDRNGDLWFATNNGVSRLTPRPDVSASAPQILLGGLRIAGVEKPISQLGSREFTSSDLAANENNLQIDYFGLDFRAGETLRYQYELEGVDADWSVPSKLRTVTYGNLQPASYRFLVRAVNSEGVVSQSPAVVSFRILSPIWRRWWFVFGGVLIASLLIVGFYRYRVAKLREINAASEEARQAEEKLRFSGEERLAEMEELRSRIATDLHDDIGASLTQIAILSEVAQTHAARGNGNSHEPLEKITEVSNELVGTMSDIVWSINPSKDHLSDLSQRMRRFAADVLSSKAIRFHFRGKEGETDTVINSNLRRELFLIFKESINNVVKHAGAKNVWVDLIVIAGKLELTIRDDGKGFDPDGNELEEKGNGLASMKRRANELSGQFKITSAIGATTTISVSFPVDNVSPVNN